MSNYIFTNQVSANPINPNVGWNNSWISVDNNAGRSLFANASYITNFDDLVINLSASDVTIGNVHIADAGTGLHADVADVGIGQGALRVLTQDLEAGDDDISIGDRNGNIASVNPALSAINVYPVVRSGGFTMCETLTFGPPSFVSRQILIHNPNNSNAYPILTLTSGMSCRLPLSRSSQSHNFLVLDLSVYTIDAYEGCDITLFA